MSRYSISWLGAKKDIYPDEADSIDGLILHLENTRALPKVTEGSTPKHCAKFVLDFVGKDGIYCTGQELLESAKPLDFKDKRGNQT